MYVNRYFKTYYDYHRYVRWAVPKCRSLLELTESILTIRYLNEYRLHELVSRTFVSMFPDSMKVTIEKV